MNAKKIRKLTKVNVVNVDDILSSPGVCSAMALRQLERDLLLICPYCGTSLGTHAMKCVYAILMIDCGEVMKKHISESAMCRERKSQVVLSGDFPVHFLDYWKSLGIQVRRNKH